MVADFVKNAHRNDTNKNSKFRVFWDDKPILGISKMKALKRTPEVVMHSSGGENSTDHESPGRTSYIPITMKCGISRDP